MDLVVLRLITQVDITQSVYTFFVISIDRVLKNMLRIKIRALLPEYGMRCIVEGGTEYEMRCIRCKKRGDYSTEL